jgi:hypothetical protein
LIHHERSHWVTGRSLFWGFTWGFGMLSCRFEDAAVWETQGGLRVLKGLEAEFYLTATQYAAVYLWDMVREDDVFNVRTGDRIFDQATVEQKVVLLHQCLSALLRSDVPAPLLTNVSEAAAFFPFTFMEMRVIEDIEYEQNWTSDGELDEDDHELVYGYRQLVWKTYEALILPRHEPEPEEDEFVQLQWRSTDVIDWGSAIDALADLVFSGRDWQLTSSCPQVLDGLDENIGDLVGIGQDYFINRLPSVTEDQVMTALAEIEDWKL